MLHSGMKMQLLHLKKAVYEARLSAYEAALRAMKHTFGVMKRSLFRLHVFCPKFGQKMASPTGFEPVLPG